MSPTPSTLGAEGNGFSGPSASVGALFLMRSARKAGVAPSSTPQSERDKSAAPE
uniref:Alternative protein NXPH4 n=1 Tax=Homo sapiens TaxID=9606 RepID=L8E7Y3_HUMAN|nr:alternative protein NXPH4 [Homo sapiens]